MGGDRAGRAILRRAAEAVEDGEWQDLATYLEDRTSETQASASASSSGVANGRAAYGRAAAAPPATAEATEAPAHGPMRRLAGYVACWADAHPWLATLAVQAVVIAAYAPAFWFHGFVMDDTVAIERNPNVVGEWFSLSELMRRDYWGLPMHGAGWTNKSFRPLTTWTFRLNYLLHGLKSCGFHIANVLFHCLASAVVGRSASLVAGVSGGAAAVCAALFGLHPVHTENVLYLVCRADVLAALCGLVGLNDYSSRFHAVGGVDRSVALKRPQKLWLELLGLSPFVLLTIASGLCKETGFMLFAVPVLAEVLDCLQGFRRPCHPRARWRPLYRAAALLACAVVVFFARYRHTGGTKLNMSPQDNPISFESESTARILSYALLHGVYAKILVWPWFLCYDYSMDAIPIVRTAADSRLLLTAASYVGLAAAITASLGARSRKRRAALVSLALMVVPFLPASNVLFPVGTVIGERLLYLPSIGLCMFFVVWAFPPAAPLVVSRNGASASTSVGRGAKGQLGHGRRPLKPGSTASDAVAGTSSATGGVALACCVAGLLGVFGVRTYFRVQVWSSSESLFLHDGQTQPRSSKTQFNLGITHMQRQEWDQAVEAFVRCAYADPLSSLPFYRIGQIEIMRGRFDTAESYLAAALDKFGASLMVRDEEVFHDLAIALFQNGKPDASERRLGVALQLNPEFAKGWANLACCIASRDLQQAARAAQKAVSIMPENPQYWANLALLSRHAGDPAVASEAWNNARALYPAMPEPRDCTWEFAPGG